MVKRSLPERKRIEIFMYCPHCGAQNPENASFCISCGTPVDASGSPQNPCLKPGTLLDGRYRIESHISSGGFGRIYRALDSRFNAAVALKEMNEGSFPEDERPALHRYFQQEAQVLFSLKHHALPRVTDYFREGRRFYLVMDFVEGENLRKLMEREALPLDGTRAVDWLLKLLDIMEYLHSRTPPIIHRDIKPDNLILQGEHLFLVDFGIARMGCATRTLSYGTMGYAPPEQASGRVHPSVDIYAAGATLHHLLTQVDPACRPFDFESLMVLRPDIPPSLALTVDRMVALKARDRFQSAAEARAFYHENEQNPAEAPQGAEHAQASGAAKVISLQTPEEPSFQNAAAISRTPSHDGPALLPGCGASAISAPPESLSGRAGESAVILYLTDDPVPAPLHWPVTPSSPPQRREDIIYRGLNEQNFEVYLTMRDRSEMVWIPDGSFIMGAADEDRDARGDEKPPRRVHLKGFWLSVHPITNLQYARFLQDISAVNDDWEEYWEKTGDHYPAASLSWADARAYCRWAGGDLPTEAQWEKGSRGVDAFIYPWGNFPDNSRFNSWDSPGASFKAFLFEDRGPSPVGSYRGGASPWGCRDMVGNVWEWCLDAYDDSYYRTAPGQDPFNESPRQIQKIMRGGSWNELPRECRSTRRGRADGRSISRDRGFRCALAP